MITKTKNKKFVVKQCDACGFSVMVWDSAKALDSPSMGTSMWNDTIDDNGNPLHFCKIHQIQLPIRSTKDAQGGR